ncbi:MAG: hypothetical protein IJN54_10310 [Lachnospiraceae bacterium]|nr:hypothetical protein [Lachnospiraceae bacterium]
MNLVQKLMWWKKKKSISEEVEYVDENEESWEEPEVLDRKQLDIRKEEDRERYLRTCCEQITDASKEMENLTYEYSLVTSYLKDIEEIEALPSEQRRELNEFAEKIVNLEKIQQSYTKGAKRITDVKFRQMEALEDEVQEGYKKIREAEEYRALVRQDLQRLDGERHAYHYRRAELRTTLENARGMSQILLIAAAACIFMLIILQVGLEMNVKIGYMLTAALAAVAVTYFYVRYSDAEKELQRVNSGINRLILLQNTVKIRYVNNKNLLDYLYMKFKVESASELDLLWQRYQEEVVERQKIAETEEEYSFYQKQLLHALFQYNLKDPNIWLHQAIAIVDNREMVEIRHELIERRQNIRKQMDYNTEVARNAQGEIKDIVDKYPQYTKEISNVISQYNKAFP